MAQNTETENDIDLTALELDMAERAQGRLLYQFQNSIALRGLVVALANMEQATYNAFLNILRCYHLPSAVGAQLDVLGRIVGQFRILLNAANLQWFGADVESDRIGGTDATPAWVQGAPVTGDLPANDRQYRNLIIGKIFKNHVKSGSVPEIIQFGKFLTGRDISVINLGLSDIRLSVPSDMSRNDVQTLLTVYDDTQADRHYLTPIAASVRIEQINYRPNPLAFTPDRVDGGTDGPRLAITVPASIF